jgi:hypothetical protein
MQENQLEYSAHGQHFSHVNSSGVSFDPGNVSLNNENTSNIIPVHCEEPWSNVPENVFPNLWRVVYWTSQFLTW